ncbi:NAD-dependent epimerase/dehydratase family protein [Streptomyces diacarni]|uniref:NAD-dependent epimerase/dehydratase family protein n=1 Tax=Streptomyces diacarni TaxID=2800381 RepID=A0A367FFU6_9ACTN|nr:NAD-dependent epimerase/dehydratase family protein [Streptomyces diacarni]RCG28759.1 NAD-dependent epimerase/dehydratase family protein [Streptomyces diacarni]
MEIIGRGFIARHLGSMEHRHPHVVALASGVSQVDGVSADDYQREADLVYETIRRCQEKDQLLLYFSTASAGMYDATRGCRGREDDPVFPGNAHGRNKLLLETVIRASGVRHLVIRLSHAFGVHQSSHQLMPALLGAVSSRKVRIHRGSSRDIIHVSDAMTIVDRLLTAGVDGEVVNVASGVTVPPEAIIEHMSERLQLPILEKQVVEGDASVCLVSLDKLRRLVPEIDELGFGDTYYKRAIDRYVAEVEALGAAEGTTAEAAGGSSSAAQERPSGGTGATGRHHVS